jgi:hypothetical protein
VSPPRAERRLDRLFDRLLARRGWVLAAWGLLAAVALPGVARLETDNSPEVFFVQGSASLTRYRQLEAAFGSSEHVRLVASGDGLWTRAGLTWLGEIEARAAEAPWALGAIGLAGHRRSLGLAWPPLDPEAFQRRARENRLDRELGLAGGHGGAAGEVATVLVSIEPPDKAAEAETVAALERLVAEPPPGVSARAAGLPVLDLALDASSREIVRVFFPILVGLAVVLLGLSFRDPRGVALPLLFVAAPEVVLLGALGALGVSLNLVLAILPPLLFVIALATAVHLQVRFRDALEDGLRGAEAVRATYEDKGWAVLWTGVTTMIGFGSLAVSRVGPIPHLGLASAVGIALILLAAFTLLPALFAVAGAPARGIPGLSRPRAFERRFRRLGRAWAERAADRRAWVIAAAAVAVAVAVAGLPRLRVESDAVRFLPAGHPARVGIEELEAAGVGVAAAELFLTLPPEAGDGAGPLEGGLRRPDRMLAMEDLGERLRRLPKVLGVVGAGDLLAEATSRLPASLRAQPMTPALALGALAGDPRGGRLLRGFVAEDGRSARLTLFVPTAGHREMDASFARAEELAREAFPGARADVTGEFPLLLATQRRLPVTLALSLSLTTLAVAAIFRLLLPSTHLALLAMVPNLWPVAIAVGGMAWLGVPLDTATVMVGSVVLGLAVDDTIHTLGHFRELAPRVGTREAVAGTLERTAPAYVLTGAILAAGFGVCALSDFAPIARFGGLSAVAIVLAVLGALVLLPALLGTTPHAVVGRLGRGRGGRHQP